MKFKWKHAFFWLLILNGLLVSIMLVIYFSLFLTNNNVTPQANSAAPTLKGSPVFKVSANKDQLAAMMNGELQKKLKGNLEASISLKDNLAIIGNIKLLGIKIPFDMTFQPSVEQAGEEIVLNEKSVTLGHFSLPVSEVLAFIQKGSDFPSWIVVEPNKKQLVAHLSGFVIKDQFTVRAAQIDLPKNKLVFNVYKSNSSETQKTP